jgi:branched-chain amino acid transport system substrate-binding protein
MINLVRPTTAALAVAAMLPVLSGAALAAEDTVTVGAATATSGWMAAYDDGPVSGAQLAVNEINAKGGLLGKKLKIEQRDTKTEVAGAAQAGAELLEDGAAMMIISCDFDMGAPSALVANQKKVIAFSTCGADNKLGNLSIGRYVFTMATDAESIGGLMADWSIHNKGWKSAYLLLDPEFEYTKSICRGFEKAWSKEASADTIAGRDTYLNDDASFAAQITRLKALPQKPDVVALCGVSPGFPSAIKQLRAAGIDAAIVSGVGFDGDGWRASIPSDQLTNVYYASYSSARGDDPRPEIGAYNADFKTLTGNLPSTGQSVTGHSVVTAWARAVERAKSFDSDAVLAELEKMKDEPLTTGLTTFTPNMHITTSRPMLVFGYEAGTPHALGYYDPASHEYVTWWK